MCCKIRLTNQHYQWIRYFSVVTDLACSVYKIFMKVIGPIMFVGANILILSIAAIFIFLFIPEYSQDSIIVYFFNVGFGLYLLINIFFNYFACAFTPPGSPSYCPDPGKILGEKVSIVDGRKIYQFSYQLSVAPYVSYKYCHVCKCIKPPRAHHCSVSGRCIYNMDHYCPWMTNCVGYYNYRYFVLFLLYLFIACTYALIFLICNLASLNASDQ